MTSENYHFHHMSILTGSKDLIKDCEDFYMRRFGMRVVKAAGDNPEEGYSFLTDNAGSQGMPLEIIGEVWEQREKDFIGKHGLGIDHIAFLVENLDRAVEELEAEGVQFHVPAYDFLGSRLAWCKDPAGVEIEIMQVESRDLEGSPEVSQAVSQAQFNHVGILTGEGQIARELENFYIQNFGMKVIRRGDSTDPALDWVYLEDYTEKNPFWLEIVGPGLWEAEKKFLEQHGPGLDHICFVVDDIDEYNAWLRAQGADITTEMLSYGEASMFYLRDPAGVQIQALQVRE